MDYSHLAWQQLWLLGPSTLFVTVATLAIRFGWRRGKGGDEL